MIVVGPDVARAGVALELAAAAAAVGREASVFFAGPSVACLADPRLAAALDTAHAMGVALSACATGLADSALLPPAVVATGGLVSTIATSPDAQIVAV